MSTTISAVSGQNKISHAMFIDLTLDTTTYYISSAYKPITIDGNNYNQLGYLLQAGSITDDLKTTNGDVIISLSGIPTTLLTQFLTAPIKGGAVTIKRGFFGTDTYEIISGQVYTRYKGIITNYTIEETMDVLTGDRTHTIAVTCASLNTLLENKVSGQRTNSSDRNRFYPGDISFDRVKELQNTSFDFGKPYSGGTGYGGGGYGPGGGGGFDPFNPGGGFNFQLP